MPHTSPFNRFVQSQLSALVIKILIFLIGIILGLSLYQLLSTNNKSIDIANSAIALGGLIVAFMTILASYFQRVDPQRQSLYQAHLDAYQEIYSAMLDVVNLFLELRKDITDESKKFNFEKSWQNLEKTSRCHWIILPSSVRGAFIDYEATIVSLRKVVNEGEKKITSSTWKKLADGHVNMFNILRETLGIERLHGETTRLIGIPEKYTEK